MGSITFHQSQIYGTIKSTRNKVDVNGAFAVFYWIFTSRRTNDITLSFDCICKKKYFLIVYLSLYCDRKLLSSFKLKETGISY